MPSARASDGGASAGVTLALSASGERFSVAVRQGDRIAYAESPALALSRELFPTIDRLLAGVGAMPADVRELRVDRGPGSYTGLRVALTFARVLAELGGAPVLVATSFELMAIAAWRGALVPETQPLRLVLDARRERLHTARVALVREHAVVQDEPRALALPALGPACAGDEVLLAPAALHATLAGIRRTLLLPPYGARELFDPWLAPTAADPAQLAPLYLMGPYTERPA